MAENNEQSNIENQTDEHKKYSVYCVGNKINWKVYIGYSEDPNSRWTHEKNAAFNPNEKPYNYPLSRAIRKYGWDNFSKVIIAEFDTKSEALAAEIFWIAQFKSNVKRYGKQFGYNQTDGGEVPSIGKGINNPNFGRKATQETRRKQSEALKGRQVSQETRDKISRAHTGTKRSQEAKNKMSKAKIGKSLSDSHKQNLSVALTGKPHSKEQHQKIADSNRGKKRTQESKDKMSQAHKGQIPWMKGRSHSDESKKLISEALSGANNPNTGKPRSDEVKKKISEAKKGKPSKNKGNSWKLIDGKRIWFDKEGNEIKKK